MTDIVDFCCDFCGRVILCDSVVSDEEWKRISPTNDEGGMLCASCIVDRLGYCAALISDAHSAQMTDEIEHLRLSLSEARATGRREGLSEAANVADAASKEWEGDAALWHKEGMLKTAASSLIHSEAAVKVAAAIRAAMEK